MESPTTSRFRWLYTTFCLIGVIALALTMMHCNAAIPLVVHLPIDAESGAKKFDHLEFINASTEVLTRVEIKLTQPRVVPDDEAVPIANGQLTLHSVKPHWTRHWVLGHVGEGLDYVAEAECIVVRQIVVNGETVEQMYTCRIRAESTRSLRSATFWFGHPPGQSGEPIMGMLNLCGEGLSEVLEFGGNSRVLGHTDLEVE